MLSILAMLVTAGVGVAQESREAEIVATQAEKAKDLKPYDPNRAEEVIDRLEGYLAGFGSGWHPYFENAYSGGGFTLGAGYSQYVSPTTLLDVRGSWTFKNYKLLEAEYRAPRLFDRRGVFTALGGWREATEVGFYGFGTGNTSTDDRANYSFRQPYASAALDVRPFRRYLEIGGGVEVMQWDQGEGDGSAPSVNEVYTPDTLPGLGSSPTYLHTSGTVGFDWRPAVGYTRTGGYYGTTFHDYKDQDDAFGFQQVDYHVVQHIPLFRDAWVLSLRGRVQTTYTKDDQVIPFYMLPALGGGSSLRGFSSWRFRDRHGLLLQAEWRVLANRFLDMALFYDAGKVTDRRSDLDLEGLKSDFGIGFRFHGPATTPLRIEFARSNEQAFKIIFSAKHVF